ncbi:MAG TPA: adenylate/guanylate cyclase domain-containing protein, partial [Leptospiraceae bacterium]|nr:adenylate/guanylate cyclase domain-containing protein [Leptospiraceae bacterium]
MQILKNKHLENVNFLGNIYLYAICFLFIPFLFSFIFYKLAIIADLSNKIIDVKYNYIERENLISKDIVLIEIDDKTLYELGDSPSFGRWPWKRNVYEPLIDYISSGSPKGILFDILFSEITENDKYLVNITKRNKNLSHAFYFNQLEEKTEKNSVEISKFAVVSGNPLLTQNFSLEGAFPVESIRNVSSHMHGVNFKSDPDGVIRNYNFGYAAANHTYPSLAWLALIFFEENLKLSIKKEEIIYQIKNHKIKLSHQNGFVPIHYYSKKSLDTLIRISVSDIFYSIYKMGSGEGIEKEENLILPDIFKDKIVLIGATSSGASDTHNSPYGELPGTVIQAIVASNFLLGDFRNDLPFELEICIYLILSSISCYIFYHHYSLLKKVIFLGSTLLLLFYLHIFLFRMNSNLPIQFGIIYLPSFSIVYGLVLLLEERERRKETRNILDKYVSKDVVEDALSKRGVKLGEGQRREITVIFSDLRNFTSLSEQLSPEEVVQILNRYLGSMAKSILKRNGTLDKFIGDAVMAFWNAPNENTKHAEEAVKAAIDMFLSLSEINKQWKYNLKMGIGIHTGPAIAGNIGSDERLDYTVIGDTVNLASRLES